MRTDAEIRQHLSYWSKVEPSDVGLRVARLLEEWEGLHNFDDNAMRKSDWSNTLYIDLRLPFSRLSTFDFMGLTTLVFLAHDHCIRVEIRPCNYQYLSVLFHPRKTRTGSTVLRHPLLEEAVAGWRANHPQADHLPQEEPAHA